MSMNGMVDQALTYSDHTSFAIMSGSDSEPLFTSWSKHTRSLSTPPNPPERGKMGLFELWKSNDVSTVDVVTVLGL